jgi:hypothetical protein
MESERRERHSQIMRDRKILIERVRHTHTGRRRVIYRQKKILRYTCSRRKTGEE